jgi:hypothetical protein
MNERKLSELQKEYRAFFLGKMELYGVKSPAELTKEEKSKFFTEIKEDWATVKLSKKSLINAKKISVEEPIETYEKTTLKEKHVKQPEAFEDFSNQEITTNYTKGKNQGPTTKNTPQREQENSQQEFTKQIIISEKNQEQTDDLRIFFTPNNHFAQTEQYQYPVVKMPKHNCTLKLPRKGRSNQKGYKEDDFFSKIKLQVLDIEVSNNFHMVIPNYSKPYEPDMVLFDKELNLYIDIEIDEPYDGFYRYPTHNYRAEDDFKQDNIRDLFFTESGWVVIRFTEKQVHKQPNECIYYIKNVINSIYSKEFSKTTKCELENQWNENQCTQWQLNNYRENYLEIHSFYKRKSHKEVVVAEQEYEPIEVNIQRTQFEDIEKQFDKDLHKYFHPKDKTGNAEYISVTTLVERFFQFDILRYIQREAEKLNRDEEELFREFQALRDEAAVLGTELHLQIENYFTKKPFDDSLIEFKYFLNFEKEKIIPKGLAFSEAEKKIFYPKFNVAGTVDCLFKSSDGKYVMVDWKRSKKLIVNGTNKPDKRGFEIQIAGLTNLTNSSYYRYCIQQNLYRHILEQEYNIVISDMVLAVLHEKYSKYHTIKLPVMTDEIKIILNSINHKI